MFKVNNKYTTTTPMAFIFLVFLLLTLNMYVITGWAGAYLGPYETSVMKLFLQKYLTAENR